VKPAIRFALRDSAAPRCAIWCRSELPHQPVQSVGSSYGALRPDGESQFLDLDQPRRYGSTRSSSTSISNCSVRFATTASARTYLGPDGAQPHCDACSVGRVGGVFSSVAQLSVYAAHGVRQRPASFGTLRLSRRAGSDPCSGAEHLHRGRRQGRRARGPVDSVGRVFRTEKTNMRIPLDPPIRAATPRSSSAVSRVSTASNWEPPAS